MDVLPQHTLFECDSPPTAPDSVAANYPRTPNLLPDLDDESHRKNRVEAE
jgi:hypothetical protein